MILIDARSAGIGHVVVLEAEVECEKQPIIEVTVKAEAALTVRRFWSNSHITPPGLERQRRGERYCLMSVGSTGESKSGVSQWIKSMARLVGTFTVIGADGIESLACQYVSGGPDTQQVTPPTEPSSRPTSCSTFVHWSKPPRWSAGWAPEGTP
jgi:hypothetical protein